MDVRLDERLLRAVIAIVIVCAVTIAVLWPIGALDTFTRYAVMAEEFAKGNWSEAFHPRFGVGFQVMTGSLHGLTGLDGYRCCSAVAALLWGCALFPLFSIVARSFDRRVAWFAVILYVICPQMLIWAFKGFRESGKTLGILLMADAILGCRVEGWKSALKAVLGLILLFTFKVDTILIGGVLAVVYILTDRFGKRSWIILGSSILALQPMCWLVSRWTGYWLPAVQYIVFWKRLFGGD